MKNRNEVMKKVRMCILEKLVYLLTAVSAIMTLLFIALFLVVKTKKIKNLCIIISIFLFMIFIGGIMMEYYKII